MKKLILVLILILISSIAYADCDTDTDCKVKYPCITEYDNEVDIIKLYDKGLSVEEIEKICRKGGIKNAKIFNNINNN